MRNPYSTRPYQHVLEPLFAYLIIAGAQYENPELAGYYNVGPDDSNCLQTADLVDIFVKLWGENLQWINQSDGGPHEATFLKLDCSKLKMIFGWSPTWDLKIAIQKVVEWSKAWNCGDNVKACMDSQIEEFIRISSIIQ